MAKGERAHLSKRAPPAPEFTDTAPSAIPSGPNLNGAAAAAAAASSNAIQKTMESFLADLGATKTGGDFEIVSTSLLLSEGEVSLAADAAAAAAAVAA